MSEKCRKTQKNFFFSFFFTFFTPIGPLRGLDIIKSDLSKYLALATPRRPYIFMIRNNFFKNCFEKSQYGEQF